jgi:hypothetical protein
MATSMASLQMPRRPMMGCNGHSLGECWSTDNQVPRLGVAMLREHQAFLSVKPFRLPAAATCEQCPQKTNCSCSDWGVLFVSVYVMIRPFSSWSTKLIQASACLCWSISRARTHAHTHILYI